MYIELFIILGILFSLIVFWIWDKYAKDMEELERWRWLYGGKRNGKKGIKEKED